MLMLLSQVLSQQEDVKDELDVTLVYGERDFEDTKTGMLFYVTLCTGFDCKAFLDAEKRLSPGF
jgi:hypothetical protein